MEKKTKKIVNWIKKQINIAKTDHVDKAWNGHHEMYNADYDNAMKLLDSLSDVELEELIEKELGV